MNKMKDDNYNKTNFKKGEVHTYMSEITDLFYDVKRKMLAKYPIFGSEIAKTPIVLTNEVRTGATDGKKIYINPEHFVSVDENDKLHLLSHETFHKKFMHMYRLKDKDGNMKDLKLWNIVCDAIVNANLKRDGIRIPEGSICSDMDEEYGDWVLEYNCEELYELKKRQREEQERREETQQNNNQASKQSQKQNSGENQKQDNKQGNKKDINNENSDQTENQKSDKSKSQDDSHSMWEEAFRQQQNSQKKEQTQSENSQKQQEEQEQTEEEQTDTDFDEKGEFQDNRKEKREKFKARVEKNKTDIRNTNKEKVELGNIGKSKEEIDWKLLIRKEVEKSETIWSRRRSIAENNYAYRLEENDIEEDSQTEVMIDVSGSVDLELIKSFLRQLKPLVKETKLRAGCFNTLFWKFVDIKNIRDIENFTIPKEARGNSACGTDLDLAARSFTKKREINKIVFTDGYASRGCMPKEDLKRENIIWLVYDNKEFKPCCGKVINISQKQLEQLRENNKSSSMHDMSR